MKDIKLIVTIFFITCMKLSMAKSIPQNFPLVIENNTESIFNTIITNAKNQNITKKPMGDVVTWVSIQLLDSPYKFHLLDKKTPEYLYISLTNTDCMLFVEEVVVLSRMIKANKLLFSDYIDGIKQIRYHGDVKYCNRNHYFKDWVVMNESAGVVKDIVLSLTHKPVLGNAHILSYIIGKNESNIHYNDLDCINSRESLVNKNAVGFIPLKDIPKYQKYIQSGDIIGVIASNPTKSDVIRHVGIAFIKNGILGYLNASGREKNMRVVVYKNLLDYLKEYHDLGIIVIRVQP